ncbi:MAG: apolipoprotein N-acyltransferase, partial [Candidatus Bipolaricaulia bacterium]
MAHGYNVDMIKLLKRRWLWALLSGMLLALGFPGFGLDWLSWFALIPLFFVLERGGYWRNGWYGLLAGVAFFGTLLRWLYNLKEWTGPEILWIYLLLIVYLSLYWGAFGLLYTFLKRRLGALRLSLAVPALWVLLELARSLGRLGLAWGDIGYVLYRREELIQLAAITGVWGLSFTVVWVSYLLFLTLKERDWRPFVAVILIWVLLFQLGSVALSRVPPQGRELHLALVQPNIPQERKSSSAEIGPLLDRYRELLTQTEAAKADLVVLPESILPAYLLQQQEYLEP